MTSWLQGNPYRYSVKARIASDSCRCLSKFSLSSAFCHLNANLTTAFVHLPLSELSIW